MSVYKRTLQDAQEGIELAKFSADEVCTISQVFYHPTQVDSEDSSKNVRLLDVDENFISRLEEGDRFVFRGSCDEKLVLCTDNETFDVKEGEISNALVLVPDLLYSSEVQKQATKDHQINERKVVSIMSSYLELRPTFPKLKKLRELLLSVAYRGPDFEDDSRENGFYICDLLDSVQCSRGELLSALKDLSACCIDGRWRLLDVEYESRVLSQIINLTEEKCWKEIPISKATRELQSSVPECVLNHLFENFTISTADDDIRTWNAPRLCRSFGEMLLRTGEGKFRYSEFMMAWKQCLPKEIEPDLASLRGLALMDQEGTQQQVIHLFPEYDLPENIPERFRLLFKRKEKWTLQEIEPYIERLASKAMNQSTMLTKYSRPSTLKGVRVFGARHLK